VAKLPAQAGFGLVELLVVLGILAVVMGAVNSLYVAHQRSATTEAEAVDVQQNLRIAMDQMSRDINMAGFMVTGADAIAAAVDGAPAPDSMTLNTGSESLVAATINGSNPAVNVVAGNFLDLPVIAFNGSLGGFEAAADENVAQVRIVNYRGEPLGAGTTFTVLQVRPAAGTCGVVAAPCIRLGANNAGAGSVDRGDTVLKTSALGGAEGFPHTVQYSVAGCPAPLPGQCLMRMTVPGAAGGPTVVATNVTDLQFRYLLTGNIEVDAPTVSEISLIRAVRVTITGQIIATVPVSGGTLKPRTLTSVVAIRNA
jgi:prepilin-type N-terminal cleavage/methylation domain-containing protein